MGERGKGWDRDDPRNDKVYLGILLALMATVFVAAGVAIAGEMVWQDQTLREGGFYVALVAGALYFGFRFWGRAKAAQYQRDRLRHDLAQGPPPDEDNEDGGTGGGPGGRAS